VTPKGGSQRENRTNWGKVWVLRVVDYANEDMGFNGIPTFLVRFNYPSFFPLSSPVPDQIKTNNPQQSVCDRNRV